ncbi:MAG: glutathione transferase [Lentisphaerae bacterium RIFOXYB12_FULL_65_16]|nr:MAG: glutathione transferase [Lentisphaerae bacterium RIFOXYA12_64_32]OGV89914.1 MAG: glutathione transferase [Lentisphaerae bacterium RIFOXYB12_FULL_65_16]
MITGINHITLSVRDIPESFAFYTDVLGLKPVQKSPSSAYVLAGPAWIALTLDSHARTEPLPEYTHIAFSVSQDDFAPMKARLEAAGARKWQENRTEGDSYYFLDPNGHKLEIHTTDLQTRIADGKRIWGDQVQWFV